MLVGFSRVGRLFSRPSLAMLEQRIAPAGYLRVVTYNTANDVSGNTSVDYLPRTGMGDVLQAMGALNVVAGTAHPIDILALQESVYYSGTGINPTAQGFVNLLNSLYGSGAYAAATLNGQTTGNTAGNGPQTLVYRTSTLQLLDQQALGTPSGSGVARQVMEYRFHPVGQPASINFWLFSDHFKAGTSTSDNDRRGIEADIIAAAADALPDNSPVIYVGDYNPTNNTADQGYQGVVTGTGSLTNRAIDPFNPNNVSQVWSTSSALAMETESPATSAAFTGESTGGMHFRDDLVMTSPAMAGGAVQYLPGSCVIFGNTATHQYLKAVSTGSSTALAAQLPGYTATQAGTVLTELTQVADHLPVVADFRLNTAPRVASYVVGDGTPQRSRVASLAVTFDQAVTLPANAAAAFQLTRADGTPVSLAASVSGSTVTLTFTGGAVDGASLADGRYNLAVLASQVSGPGGLALDGNGDGTAGDNFALTGDPATNKLFRLYGDSDGDGDVDTADFGAFHAAFGTPSPTFDFDGDGDVDATDLGAFRQRFGTSV